MDTAVYLRDFREDFSRPKRGTSFQGNGNAISRGAAKWGVPDNRLFFDIIVNSLRMLFVRSKGRGERVFDVLQPGY